MNRLMCSGCGKAYFTSAVKGIAVCPVCSVTIQINTEKRLGLRVGFEKACEITAGFSKFTAAIVDISDTGVGLKGLDLPLTMNEDVYLAVTGLAHEKRAKVVWVQKSSWISRAGLQFCQ